MYEQFFGLSDRPFVPAPSAKRYFPVAAAESARTALLRCVERAEGIGVLVGPAGSGKTLLCQSIAEQFRARFSIILLAGGRVTTCRNLLQAMLFELGLPYRGMEEGELRLALSDYTLNREPHDAGLLLIVDEAHTLPLRLLEEVRLLTNIVRNGQPRVRLVLAGAAKLEERLASPKLESFNQRIAVRSYLQSFNYDETLAFVKSAVALAGGKWETILTADALDAVYRATDGIPRLVNQVCDHALMLAYAGGVRRLDKSGIEEAWADLQQLPTPWNAADGAPEAAPDIIEFGALDDDEGNSRDTAAKASAPRLVTVATDDLEPAISADMFIGEPAERLEKIGDELEKLNDDYRPVAKITPEIELVFPTVDPFLEAFAEEEVVIDRIAAMQRDPLAGRPLVRSAEGHEIAVMMPPIAEPAALHFHPEKDLAAVSVSNSGEGASEDDRQSDLPLDSSESSEELERQDAAPVFVAAYDPVMPETTSDQDEVEDDVESTSHLAAMRELPAPLAQFDRPHSTGIDAETGWLTTALGPAAVAAGLHDADAPSDEDILVIEDDPQDPQPSSPPPSPVRRQEYKGLFARLRRG
jgi:type II secretory pathway predicted ATPase ExeA